jgi:alpha-D-ribose 1-methylphosphonate 5-triphosphate synthase subunit PhnH
MHTDANSDSRWTLSGPGIQNFSHLTAEGLPEDFVLQWAANHAVFPRGVDLFLATQTQLLGLPRTTSIQLSGGL